MNGLLVIDKPGGITSRDVVNRVQKWFPRKTKIGHTGTLDPLATGVLVVCIGAATRLAHFVQAMGKSYASRVRLGATSSTDDADGEVAADFSGTPPSRERIDAALASFVGDIAQVPPAVSALKVDGRRAHSLARQGVDVAFAARPVRVDAARIVGYGWPFLDIEIDCGKGTYIRSIARDLGATLGCGGMVQTLRRTRIGPFDAGQGVGIDATPESALARLMPMATAIAGMPEVCFTAEQVARLRTGQSISTASGGSAAVAEDGDVAVIDPAGELVAIGTMTRGVVQPDIVFRL